MNINKKDLGIKIAHIKETGQKTCCDCFHCKVSAEKTHNKTWYFCAVSKSKSRKQDVFWLAIKKVCKKFDDMDIPETRRPLLRNKGVKVKYE
jgi:phospholipase C